MKGAILWKLILSVLVVGWAAMNLIPLRDTPFEEHIEIRATANEAEFADLLQRARDRVADGTDPTLFLALRNLAQEEQIDLYTRYFPDINLVDVRNVNRRNEILMRVLLDEPRGKVRQGLDLQGGVAFTLRIDDEAASGTEAENRLDKAIEIMTNRVDGLGVAEPIIRAIPPDRLEIQLPGLNLEENPDAAASLRRPARLEFREVHRYLQPERDERPGTLRTLPVNPAQPDGPTAAYEVLVNEIEDRRTGEISEEKLYVKRIPEATGEIIRSASPFLEPNGAWAVSLTMTSDGTDVFADITRRIHQEDRRTGTRGRFAIVLDGSLYSAPGVNEPILGGRGQISGGNITQREAIELSNVLNNPLEFELVLDEMYEVGPSLAEDARRASINAAMLGASLVVVFMVLYYLGAGLVAVISVLLNVTIVLGVLASIGATLTLPGVAALVLTIGMAVDANILIFERIREEIKAGKSLVNAVRAGYDKALSAIVDANVTTLITAGILIWLGTGPVKGFGVTLSIGIGATLFSALIISRFLLEILVGFGITKKLLHYGLLTNTSIPFLQYRKPAFMVSWLIVLAGVITIGIKGDQILGIDFRGGTEIIVDFNQDARDDLQITRILELSSSHDLGEVQPVFQSLIGEDRERLRIQMDDTPGRADAMMLALNETYPHAAFVKVSENIIGASVSEMIQRNAILSVAVALIAVLLYVALRFEVGYGMGAVVATIHDVLMTIGIFVILGGQFTAPMVAAILMIMGYSLNDTIVVFDRIREELDLNPEATLFDIVNQAINKTLSRTLLTSVTTFMAATALFIFGAGVINDFALVFMIGILTGTFSSMFIASPVFYWWHKGSRQHVTEREFTRPQYEWEATTRRTARKPQTGES